ncbi:efflux RND transporter periplasmic adaptor subunit [Falsihalocynthiibacter sp. BN13B15]|uniref:efflux RND transporter periplasmic adaptor subunit n=1 Tax=Falsihalocynthiibacter sp. BN13B15 TaxID=3240871 RepID=UPI00350FAD95
MANKKRSRSLLTIGVTIIIVGAVAAAFWPRPTKVDMAQVTRDTLTVTINEEGRTRVHEPYIVATPVAGRLMRVELDPGDIVERGKTVVARMRPISPSALDVRTREQARALVSAAEASLRVAQANLNAVLAEKSIVDSDLNRAQKLATSGTVSAAVLERAEGEARASEARMETARAAISMREAEVANARSQLIEFDGPNLSQSVADTQATTIPLYAPIDGRILQVIQKSETTLPAGTPILEIGDVQSDLEVVVELISTEAVRVTKGDRVIIEDWGFPEALVGSIIRIEPYGFTKFSALGVEEQRVLVIIGFDENQNANGKLGHGYRVEVRIIVWEEEDVLTVPASALFRVQDKWATYVVVDGVIETRILRIGQNNGLSAQVLDGLAEGGTVVLYPSTGLTDGTKVTQRVVE